MINVKIQSALFFTLLLASSMTMASAPLSNQDIALRMGQSGGLVGTYDLIRGINVNGGKTKYLCPSKKLALAAEQVDSTNPVMTIVNKDCVVSATDSCVLSTMNIRNQKSKGGGINILDLDDQMSENATPTAIQRKSSDTTRIANLDVNYERLTLRKTGGNEELEYRLGGGRNGPDLSCIYKRVSTEAKASAPIENLSFEPTGDAVPLDVQAMIPTNPNAQIEK